MRALLVAILAAVAVVIATQAQAQDAATYRIDAIFDTSKGVIPGQLVKIAGARVGTVKDVTLTDDYKARIEMEIEGRFAPFRKDAACTIQPEGLIAENFVQCEPGTPDAPELEGAGDVAPTVPVQRNAVPVNLTDLFEIWQTPVRQRLSLILAAIGAGAAGNGERLNELLLRASPTLATTRKLVKILDDQRDQVATFVKATDRVIADLARRKDSVRAFIDQTDRVTARTAARSSELAEGIQRLPGLLDAAQPALRDLQRLARDGRPLLRDLRAAAPSLATVMRDVVPFSNAGVPALRALSRTADIGRKTAKDSVSTVALLRTFAGAAGPTGIKLDALLRSLRDTGGVEYLLQFFYNGAAATARYDQYSHLIPAHLNQSVCMFFATTPEPDCSARFPNAPVAAAERKTAKRKEKTSTPSAPAKAPSLPDLLAPAKPGAPVSPLDPVQKLVDRLADTLKPKTDDPGEAVRGLIDFLLR